MIKKRFNPVLYDEKFKALLKKYGVKRIAIFGSYASGRSTAKSDMDFLVEFQKGASLFDMSGLKLDMQDFLKRNVDIATPKSLNRYIRRKILDQAVYLYE